MSEQDKELTPEEIWAELDEQGDEPNSPQRDEPTVREAAPEKEESAEPEAAQAAPEKEADDPYEGLPQRVRDELLGVKTMVVGLSDRLRKSEGRLGELNAALKSRAAQVRDDGGEAPTATEIKSAQEDPAKFAKLREDYPDFAEAIEDLFKSRSSPGESAESVQAKLDEMEQRHSAALDYEKRRLRVELRHPGWEDEVKQPQFAGWINRQQPEIKMLADSDEPAAAIRVLDLYRVEHPEVRKTNVDLAAAAALPGGKRSTPRAKPVDEMTPTEYWAHLDAIDRAEKAKAAGRR